MLAFIRYIPSADDTCNVLKRDTDRPLKPTAVKPCGERAVAVLKIRSSVLIDPDGTGRPLCLCAHHAAELSGNLIDAFRDDIVPSKDFPPGTEMPGF